MRPRALTPSTAAAAAPPTGTTRLARLVPLRANSIFHIRARCASGLTRSKGVPYSVTETEHFCRPVKSRPSAPYYTPYDPRLFLTDFNWLHG